MKINNDYNGQTRLKDWWVIVKSNFAIIKENIDNLITDMVGVKNNMGDIDILEDGSLSDQIKALDEKITSVSDYADYLGANLIANYYTQDQIDEQILRYNTALQSALDGQSVTTTEV